MEEKRSGVYDIDASFAYLRCCLDIEDRHYPRYSRTGGKFSALLPGRLLFEQITGSTPS